jgi:hypothetical protein
MYKTPLENISSLAQADVGSSPNNSLIRIAQAYVTSGESPDFYRGFISACEICAYMAIIAGNEHLSTIATVLSGLAAEEFMRCQSEQPVINR